MTRRMPTPAAAAPDPINRRSLHDELLDRLRGMITSGDLAPGEKIQEMVLCAQFNVSRTPLREALKVLASEGVVSLQPNRGAVVNMLTIAELEEVFPIMGALESLSGEIACRNITDAEISEIARLHSQMLGHWRRGELQSYFRLNQAIHEAILKATRNETLIGIYRGLASRVLTARYIANLDKKRWARAVEEHEAMLAALRSRDGSRLAAILKTHLANKLETVKAWLADRTASSARPPNA